jgi:putative DNA primase/helicase
VAKAVKARWPASIIVIAGDDDAKTEQQSGINPGVKKATEAAAAIKAQVSFPPFTPEQKQAGLTDWNDYYTNKKAAA